MLNSEVYISSNNSVHNPLEKHHPQPYQYQQREFRRDQQLHQASLTKKKRVSFHSRTTVYHARGPRPLIFAPNRAKRLPTSPSLISKAVLSTRVVSGFFINGKGRAQTSIIDRVIATNWAPSTATAASPRSDSSTTEYLMDVYEGEKGFTQLGRICAPQSTLRKMRQSVVLNKQLLLPDQPHGIANSATTLDPRPTYR